MLARSFRLDQTEMCELARIALTSHKATVSRILAIAIKMLNKQSSGIQLIVSFADPGQGHNGSIYQAGNWLYTGQSKAAPEWFHNGKWKHNREMTSGAFGRGAKVPHYRDLPSRTVPGKHRYLMPLDAEMRARILPLAKPYPKRPSSIAVDASGHQPEEEGSSPIGGLQEDVLAHG